MPTLLPQDGFDTNLSAALNNADTVAFINFLPTKTAGYLVVFNLDGVTIAEKIKYTNVASNPNRLTGLTRRLPLVDTAGVISDTTDPSLPLVDHVAGARIAMTDNIHYTGRALSQLNGDEELGGVPRLPTSRVINDNREVIDKEYADGLAVAGTPFFAVSQNGADPSLTVNVNAGTFIKKDGSSANYAGASAQAVANNATNYVQLDPTGSGALDINQVGFTNGYFPLAVVVTSGGDITGITDRRAFLSMNDGLVDQIRTWSTVQTIPADNLQVSGDANSDNDAVRKLYLDKRLYSDGSDGALNVASGTTTLTTDKIWQHTTGNIAAGATLTVGGAAARKPLVLFFDGDVTIDGTIELSGQGLAGAIGSSGNPGAAGSAGRGIAGAGAAGGGGESSTASVTGNDGGAASGTTGGAGGTGAAGNDGGGGGNNALMTSALSFLELFHANIHAWGLGSGGGSGGGGTVAAVPFAGSAGGDGGGALIIIARGNITIGATGLIKCNGINGNNSANNGFSGGNGGGGGGGGGGTCLIIHGGTFTNNGSINVAAGTGGLKSSGTAPLAGAGGNGGNGTSVQIQA